MPWIEHENGCNKPNTVGRHDGNDERVENLVLKNFANAEPASAVNIRDNRFDGDEDGSKHQVSGRSELAEN